MYKAGTMVNVPGEVVSVSSLTDKDLPEGLTRDDFEKIPEIVPIRVRMTKSKLTRGGVIYIQKSILSKVKK